MSAIIVSGRPMKVKELIAELKKVNPEADIKIWFNDEIAYLSELGGNSFNTTNPIVWINLQKQTY